ncbi:MAG: succinate dehydrogenase, hydrophobic membrane anchor protein [Candidatus Omnitrophica bacterium]|nr:succinate dehydrogenase, hydrophobic membrane anchor protein [Candidatus Omnitrophota bacterium]
MKDLAKESWFWQRVTGAVLVVGMSVHIIILPLAGKLITFESVYSRLSKAGWALFDFILLSACVYHGFNGLWSVIADFNPEIKIRKVAGWFIFLIGGAGLFYGLIALYALTK